MPPCGDDDDPVDTGAFDSAILATRGARVFIESCWFSGFGRYGIQAQDGAHVQARDCTFNRGYSGVVSDGARVELERVDPPRVGGHDGAQRIRRDLRS